MLSNQVKVQMTSWPLNLLGVYYLLCHTLLTTARAGCGIILKQTKTPVLWHHIATESGGVIYKRKKHLVVTLSNTHSQVQYIMALA